MVLPLAKGAEEKQKGIPAPSHCPSVTDSDPSQRSLTEAGDKPKGPRGLSGRAEQNHQAVSR